MKNRNIVHKDDWKTPECLYKILDSEFKFDFDPCPYMHNMKWDGLQETWGNRNFINPPYSRFLKEAFVKKAVTESQKGKICVMLLPVSTSSKLFHEWIQPYASEIRFLKGRVRFTGINSFGELVKNKNGMHDSMVVVFKGIPDTGIK